MKNLDSLKRGVIVFLSLGILTVIEYFLGTNNVPQILLWFIALLKMVLVLHFFMHFNRVLRQDEGDHS